MLSTDENSGSRFRYVDLRARVPQEYPFIAGRRRVDQRYACGDVTVFPKRVSPRRASWDRAGEVAAGPSTSGVLLGSIRAPVDGADRVNLLLHRFVGPRFGGPASRATVSAECQIGEAVLMRWEDGARAVTVGDDNACDTTEFVANCAAFWVGPHVAHNNSDRRSNFDEEVAESAPYWAGQVHCKRIEGVFAGVTTLVGLWKTRHCGLAAYVRSVGRSF